MNSINSVQFSNHTGYPSFKGQVLSGEDLTQLIDGMDQNGLLKGLTAMLTGYIGSATFLNAISDVIDLVQKQNPDF